MFSAVARVVGTGVGLPELLQHGRQALVAIVHARRPYLAAA